eukprot:CAMPEP_0184480360 /NCGR_PEP_ID=MMETSP0113_2-20130426/1853_1 /TAXON_ID=91329 /ORGANISM="Norrisiella sphaerica, Strain BC52" /LENGTH=365 /DNA_ID=CAMNT_0026858783 /DNA_START=237 /DNA_END=1334 /DNA_ORIENTATION=+
MSLDTAATPVKLKKSPRLSQRFKIIKTLHKNECGSICTAEDTFTKKKVVVKSSLKAGLRSNKPLNNGECPLAEARILSKIKQAGGHPNIVDIIDVRENTTHVALVMEHLASDLFKIIDRTGGLAENSARWVMRRAARGLRYLHRAGIAHLDISPENVLVDEALGAAKLCDFGAAREVKREGQTLEGYVVGKVNYMAPEVLTAKPFDPMLADAYSLGATLFVALFGHPAYDLEDRKNGPLAFRMATAGFDALKALILDYGYAESMPSDSAVDLLARLMALNPADRLRVEDIFNHPWISGTRSVKRSVEKSADVSEDNNNDNNMMAVESIERMANAYETHKRNPSGTRNAAGEVEAKESKKARRRVK